MSYFRYIDLKNIIKNVKMKRLLEDIHSFVKISWKWTKKKKVPLNLGWQVVGGPVTTGRYRENVFRNLFSC